MDGKPAIVLSGKAIGTTLLGVAGAVALGVGMYGMRCAVHRKVSKGPETNKKAPAMLSNCPTEIDGV
jgi:hypothetical protein